MKYFQSHLEGCLVEVYKVVLLLGLLDGVAICGFGQGGRGFQEAPGPYVFPDEVQKGSAL